MYKYLGDYREILRTWYTAQLNCVKLGNDRKKWKIISSAFRGGGGGGGGGGGKRGGGNMWSKKVYL